jgi:5-formyltetrahydrofolate cyclo-ligase
MVTTPIKRRLRAETIAAILDIDEADRAVREAHILAEIRGLPSYRDAGTVLLYLKAFPEEIETRPLLADAFSTGKRVTCPRVVSRAAGMVLHQVRNASDLRAGTLNIPEPVPDAPVISPVELDWVLAPGVAFDRRCYRLGRGAGHYDRLLPVVRPGVEVWAAAFDVQILDAIPDEPHDVPVTGIVTESRRFRRP